MISIVADSTLRNWGKLVKTIAFSAAAKHGRKPTRYEGPPSERTFRAGGPAGNSLCREAWVRDQTNEVAEAPAGAAQCGPLTH